METNVNFEELRNDDKLQEELINDTRVIMENGLGGYKTFVEQFNPDLLLGVYTIDKKMAEILTLKNMKNYTQEINGKGEPNYKNQRIIHFGAEKVKAREFPTWIQDKWQKIQNVEISTNNNSDFLKITVNPSSSNELDENIEISTNDNSEFQKLTVNLIESTKSCKIFEVKYQDIIQKVEVGNQGTWFFTNEAFIISAMISETKAAEAIVDKFMQFGKMGEIGLETAKSQAKVIQKLEDSGLDLTEFLEPEEYYKLKRDMARANNIEFSPEFYRNQDKMIADEISKVITKINEIEDQIRNTNDRKLKIKLNNDLQIVQYNLDQLRILHKRVSEEVIYFNNFVKTKKDIPKFKAVDIAKEWNSNHNTKFNQSKILGLLIKLDILYTANNNFYPVTINSKNNNSNRHNYGWMRNYCGKFQQEDKKGKETAVFNSFGKDFVLLLLDKYDSSIKNTEDEKVEDVKMYIEESKIYKPAYLEAILYGKKAYNEFNE